MKFVPEGPINTKSALVHVMALRRTGDKPLPDARMTQLDDAHVSPDLNMLTHQSMKNNGQSNPAIRTHAFFVNNRHFIQIPCMFIPGCSNENKPSLAEDMTWWHIPTDHIL